VKCMSSTEETPLWICAVGTVEIPSMIYRLGGGLCLSKYETSTVYNSDIRTRIIQEMKVWGSKVGETPMQQHPWLRKCLMKGENVFPDPREMPSASKTLHILCRWGKSPNDICQQETPPWD
jgi:hypothetical protein